MEGRIAYIQADLRNPQVILSSPVVQFIPDEDGPAEIVARLAESRGWAAVR